MSKIKFLIIALLVSLLCPQLVLGEVKFISDTTVTLELSADDGEGSGVKWQRFSDNRLAEDNWTDPEPYTTTRKYEFSSGDGIKCVYVQYADAKGNWSESIPIKINPNDTSGCRMLDQTPPTGTLKIVDVEVTVKHIIGNITTILTYRIVPQELEDKK